MKFSICVFLVLLFPVNMVLAQGISVKTVPLLSTDQFSLAPSFRDDMGGVSIAIRDGLSDLFINPGKLDPFSRSHFFVNPHLSHWNFTQETSTRNSSPYAYYSLSKSSSNSSIFSLPIGLFLRRHHLYTGGMVGLQSLSTTSWQSANFQATNFPFTWFGGYYLSALKASIGAGIDYVRLRGIDGVYMLYPNATRLNQKGSARQFRLGLAGTLNNEDQYSLLGSRYFFKILQTEGTVTNKDENDGWLVQADYIKKITKELTIGLLMTADWRYHPKIPEYPLAGIPRDPGNTHALNIGLGMKWQNESTLFGLDFIYEPVDVKTWADAAEDIKMWDGQVIHKGGVTMRNDYRFHNRIIRSGVQVKPVSWLALATGAQAKIYEYDYYQNDFINRLERTGKPQRQWSEVTWTGGFKIKAGKFDLGYSIRLQTGNGILERQWLWRWFTMEDSRMDFAKADFLIPPTVPLNVTPVTYYTQWLGLHYYF